MFSLYSCTLFCTFARLNRYEMPEIISIEDFLRRRDEVLLLDVRTPAEYEQGHIPGAVSFPLFSNEERAEVGTLYKQQSPQAAMERGLELVGPKMAGFVRRARELAAGRELVLHCWRGGKRSGSMGWLLSTAGMQVSTIAGGYKAYRRYVLEQLEHPRRKFFILSGKTGSGKTDVLHELKKQGAQVVDLEGLANHRGSAFGALGQEPQPTTEHFTNLLYDALSKTDPQQPVWLENESRSIGRVFLPEGFWKAMLRSPKFTIEIPMERRIQRLLRDYACFPAEALKAAFQKIAKRLGGLHLKQALEAIDSGDLATAAALALRYYDKAYGKGKLPEGIQKGPEFALAFGSESEAEIAAALLREGGSIKLCE